VVESSPEQYGFMKQFQNNAVVCLEFLIEFVKNFQKMNPKKLDCRNTAKLHSK